VLRIHGQELGQGLDERFTHIGELIGQRGPALISALGDQAQQMETSLASRLSDFGEAIRGKIDAVSDSLESNSHRIAEALDHRSRQINQTLIERTREIAETFTSGQTEFAALIDGRLIEVGGQLAARTNELAETLSERASAITSALAAKTDQVAEGVRHAIGDVTQRLVNEANDATQALRASASEASTMFGRAVNDIESMLGHRAATVTEALEQRTREFNDVLGARSSELAALLDGRSNVLLRTLDQRGNDIVEMVVSRSDQAAHMLLESGDRVAQAFAATNEKMRGEVADIVDRLSRSNDLLNGLLSASTDNLVKIESNLASRANEFATSIQHAVETTQLSSGELAEQVQRLSGVSGEILEGVSNVVKRFEAQSQSLTEATRHLTEVNRQIEATVEERRPALESLAAGLRSRSEELDGMMRSFTRIISETLKTAEERATAVSRMLTENTATAAKGVIDNFENLNRTANSESRKAAEAVREANRILLEEMGGVVSDTTKRFAEATREMRLATQELQHDLNITRGELKKGVLEMPEEARESAEAMRRVVSDQIKALSDLSEIISRHGKTLDLSSPSLGEPRVAARNIEMQPVAAAVGAETQAPWSGLEQRRQPAAEFAGEAPRATAFAGNDEAGIGARSIEARRSTGNGARPSPAPRGEPLRAMPVSAPRQTVTPRPPARIPAPGQEAGGEERGWVSDLLRRASTDDEGPATPEPAPAAPAANGAAPAAPAPAAVGQPSGPLGGLSSDIARAIDHNAAVELWDRHRRGERNLFTRRLYTLQGQQTFDEIRKKYQRDEQFRSAVDRYVTDFEKLLNEVNGKDPATANAYLTSDTGKVYTMLAHASGRFD
jgi:methyl-accepting chemotaxis protein